MRDLLRHPLAGQLGRYLIAGGTVACVYIGGTVVLSDLVGLPIQLAILLAYIAAIVLHFTLQRTFVFGGRDEFALSLSAQVRSYVVIGAVQYAVAAGSTALLPDLLNVTDTVAYLLCVPVASLVAFVLLRRRVFHAPA
ncbi:GtrA family protein [Conexibacter woesei]|uniref:GtrA family protein n=1 Tax=Conexibacter woesei (strain DSM 14684 / CCUG 47730 / CIP 108061 / JCM 11494 / NBRC 100937 / ID131577) TaxID=469383 RepID=D3EZN0_CONWI|nr:GtrA family protein [Conexibacter woesei]ADB53868.1 GtrA family protein [Conexibacter woesei DSM 14684]